MAMMNWFVLTAAERTTAMAFPPSPGEIDPRAVDNASPGVGINLNDYAASYDPADPVTLTGTYVAPKRIVDDPDYGSDLKTFLLTLPWCSLESETIFAPYIES
jgi:hypothetical protein